MKKVFLSTFMGLLFAAAVAGAGLLMLQPAHAQPDVSGLKLTVVAPNGKAIPGAKIVIGERLCRGCSGNNQPNPDDDHRCAVPKQKHTTNTQGKIHAIWRDWNKPAQDLAIRVQNSRWTCEPGYFRPGRNVRVERTYVYRGGGGSGPGHPPPHGKRRGPPPPPPNRRRR